MDNIAPIVLFVLYMVISAWVKQKKAQRKAPQKENNEVIPEASQEKVIPKMGSIFEQLKKELFEIEDTPFVQEEIPVPEPEVEVVIPDEEPVPQFVEGSEPHLRKHLVYGATVLVENPLDTILEPYSKLEQGIILHEILGKPRAYQDNDDWFHKS